MVCSADCHITKILKYIGQKNNNLERIPENIILVTMDLRSLYKTIPSIKGIKVVEITLKPKNIAARIITTFFQLDLTLNNFCQNYLQIKDCAMGTKCAPNYANIFMGIFELNFIYSLANIKTRLRFIDDTFILWTGTLDQLFKSKQRINEVQLSIKFDFKFSNKEIIFLDTAIYKTSTGKFKTKLCTRIPTKRFIYITNENIMCP